MYQFTKIIIEKSLNFNILLVLNYLEFVYDSPNQ